MSSLGEIITWYSFKGGVGRSMALANVATLLAQRGKRVLVVDFDLEAPGVHRYFFGRAAREGRTRSTPPSGQSGVIELFTAFRDELNTAFPAEGAYDPDNADNLEVCRRIVAKHLTSPAYGYQVAVETPGAPEAEATLTVLTAGLFDATYTTRIQAFDWHLFFEEFTEVFDLLRQQWRERYDYVLVDSRTGLTDTGSVCTVVLPDKLVLVLSPNLQSLEGALEVGQQAVEFRADLKGIHFDSQLEIFPLLSRVEPGEEELRIKWVNRVARDFYQLFSEVYPATFVNFLRYFEAVQIAHSSYYAYGERLAVEVQTTGGFGTLAEGYGRFLDCLQSPNMLAWQDAQTAMRATVDKARPLIRVTQDEWPTITKILVHHFMYEARWIVCDELMARYEPISLLVALVELLLAGSVRSEGSDASAGSGLLSTDRKLPRAVQEVAQRTGPEAQGVLRAMGKRVLLMAQVPDDRQDQNKAGAELLAKVWSDAFGSAALEPMRAMLSELPDIHTSPFHQAVASLSKTAQAAS